MASVLITGTSRGIGFEAWVDLNGGDDEKWYSTLERDFGLNARSES